MGIVQGAGFPLAVDFGVASLKVLQLAPAEAQGLEAKLTALACVPTPEDLLTDHAGRLEFQGAELAKLVRGGAFTAKRAACAIPAARTFCTHMQLGRSEGAALGDVVRLAVAQQIGCAPEALLCRWVEVRTGAGPGPKSEVICLAAGRDLVGRLMGVLRAAKLEPVGIHPECLATLRCFDSITRRAEDENLTSLYLDLGALTTKVTIAHGRSLVFAKTIHVAGTHFDLAAARQLGCDAASARTRRQMTVDLVPAARPARGALAGAGERGGTGPGPGPGDAAEREPVENEGAVAVEDRRVGLPAPGLEPASGSERAAGGVDLSQTLETLTDEVAMCLRYHESMFPGRKVNRTVFVGGEARHRGLCQHIARALRLPAQVADPLARLERTGAEVCVGVEAGRPQPGWAVACGVALAPTDL